MTQRPLYFMVKPPPEAMRFIADLPECDRRRGAELLHMTLLPIGDAASMSENDIASIAAAMNAMEARAFRIIFDRILTTATTVSLRASEPVRGAMAFQRRLHDALVSYGWSVPPYRFDPHITLAYKGGETSLRSIDAVSWKVDRYALIESDVGHRRHSERASWTLRDT